MARTSGIVHWAEATEGRTACGKIALEPDGTRRLETDIDLVTQVNCKICLKIARPLLEIAQRNA